LLDLLSLCSKGGRGTPKARLTCYIIALEEAVDPPVAVT
jgi:hypothetical protein